MGINNRDYIRDDEQSYSAFGASRQGGAWSVWQRLLAVTIGAFVAQLLFYPAFTNWFDLDPEKVLWGGQVWRLLTYAFLHAPGQIFHILFNMLLLYYFGRRLESMYGGKEFGWFYCTAAVFAGMCFLLWGLYFQRLNGAIGASGAVMAVVMLYAMHFPQERIYLWGLIAIEMRWLVALIIVIDLHPVLLQLGGNESMADNVAHTAHLGGVLFAVLYRRSRIRLSQWTSGLEKLIPSKGTLRTPGRNSKLKIYREAPEENLDVELDRILEKINQQGESSLTDKERKTLIKASERYKNRSL